MTLLQDVRARLNIARESGRMILCACGRWEYVPIGKRHAQWYGYWRDGKRVGNAMPSGQCEDCGDCLGEHGTVESRHATPHPCPL